jgi:hypothetical protein
MFKTFVNYNLLRNFKLLGADGQSFRQIFALLNNFSSLFLPQVHKHRRAFFPYISGPAGAGIHSEAERETSNTSGGEAEGKEEVPARSQGELTPGELAQQF